VFGKLKPLNCTITNENGTENISFTVLGEDPQNYETANPYGTVVILDANVKTPEETPTPISTNAITAILLVIIIGISISILAYYTKKRKHQPNPTVKQSV
jgi:hypothetical protein